MKKQENTAQHTHELRHIELGVQRTGTYEECMKALQFIADEMSQQPLLDDMGRTLDERKYGTGYLLGNCGYSIVSLEEEALEKLRDSTPDLAAEVERLRGENERLKRELNAANELLNDGREGRGE